MQRRKKWSKRQSNENLKVEAELKRLEIQSKFKIQHTQREDARRCTRYVYKAFWAVFKYHTHSGKTRDGVCSFQKFGAHGVTRSIH